MLAGLVPTSFRVGPNEEGSTMPIVDTDKPGKNIPAARTLLVTGASVAAALTTAVTVPSSVASEPAADGGTAHSVVGAQLGRMLERRASRWPRLSTQWPTVSHAPKRSAPSSSSSTGHYSIPTSIVMCESGGNYHAVNASSGAGGAYQILPSTWTSYGGTGLPQDAPPAEQDAIAAKIYATDGRGAWSC
jgi:Transglycosylase-like domain